MLQCVVCGGSISKQGDVFVCQTCGCQYSLEEVRRMAAEGGAQAAGASAAPAAEPPQTEGSGYSKLDNLYILARRARENNNSEDAAKYYHEILLEDPNSWEAAFYGVYYTAMKCKIGEIASAASSVSNCLESTMDLILKNVPKVFRCHATL